MIRRTALVLALLPALPAAAQIYGWKDGEGRTHYSDQPPPPGTVRILQTPHPQRLPPSAPGSEAKLDAEAAPRPETTPSATPKTLAERELEFRQRRAAAAEAEAKAQEQAARDEERRRFCEQARNQLGALESGQRITRFNAAGEREYLDDAARAEEAGRLRSQLETHCR